MRITKVTTRTGDMGQTGLGNGERVSKNSLRVNAMGSVDKLNSIISISVEKKDYENKVYNIIKDYKSRINLPGFRKGHVPLSLIKKKYEKAIIAEETNKILSESLNNYITDSKLKILGNPIPILDGKIDKFLETSLII